jgi:ribosome-binding protein aMBF1 (putative translation factor)
MNTKPDRIKRTLSAEEKATHAEVRRKVVDEFRPANQAKHHPAAEGIAGRLRIARKNRGLTYEKLAAEAGLPSANTVKDVEYGRDTDLHHVEAIARALGMRLELVTF